MNKFKKKTIAMEGYQDGEATGNQTCKEQLNI